jgi:hypothetical protein
MAPRPDRSGKIETWETAARNSEISTISVMAWLKHTGTIFFALSFIIPQQAGTFTIKKRKKGKRAVFSP